ncbi:MAG: NUDIX domain-containing protein [Candidatus Pacearchaeota archaeon]
MTDEINPKREFVSTVYIVKDGKVLMTFNKNINKFIPLGGHIEENELPCDSVIREAKEESGLNIELVDLGELKEKNLPQNLDIQLDVIKPDHHHINLSYIGKIIDGEMLDKSDEDTELKWFSPEEIINSEDIFENTKEKALKAIKSMESEELNLSEYQKLAKITAKKFETPEKEILTWGLGITGEAGDIAGCIKKTYAHDNDQRQGIRENIGDMLWYAAMICNFFGWDLQEILNENIEKLKKRYPDGMFTIEHAKRKGERIDWNEK